MPLDRPYHRIWRPFFYFHGYIDDLFEIDKKGDNLKYFDSGEYVNQLDLHSLVNATRLILQDLDQLLFFIEPCDVNLKTYSHRIYELFLRAATEFETNCKAILQANHYAKKTNLNIKDYYKINQATKLSEYKISFLRWPREQMWEPFAEWSTMHTLSWYQAYNKVKHNRLQEFSNANLKNLMNAVAGLICILHAQVGDRVGGTDINGICEITNSQFEVNTNTFHLEVPVFPEAEQYSFVWSSLETLTNAVLDYPFS